MNYEDKLAKVNRVLMPNVFPYSSMEAINPDIKTSSSKLGDQIEVDRGTFWVQSGLQKPFIFQSVCFGGIDIAQFTSAPTSSTPASYFRNCLV